LHDLSALRSEGFDDHRMECPKQVTPTRRKIHVLVAVFIPDINSLARSMEMGVLLKKGA